MFCNDILVDAWGQETTFKTAHEDYLVEVYCSVTNSQVCLWFM